MENLTATEGVGIVGLLAILAKQYGPAIVATIGGLFSGVTEVSDAQSVAAFNTIRPRLKPSTAATVWAEIEPGKPVTTAKEGKK
ncbi:MAG: hypothetical protein M0R22_04395 [Dehalococcoidia bacterium]|jgi:hypothetical protein|nr:hypothetical protein [Dehalococcoidia bacterium]